MGVAEENLRMAADYLCSLGEQHLPGSGREVVDADVWWVGHGRHRGRELSRLASYPDLDRPRSAAKGEHFPPLGSAPAALLQPLYGVAE